MADGQTSEGCNPESKRVHVPFGTWVLLFVRFAPNDRFGPESVRLLSGSEGSFICRHRRQ